MPVSAILHLKQKQNKKTTNNLFAEILSLRKSKILNRRTWIEICRDWAITLIQPSVHSSNNACQPLLTESFS